MTDVVGLFATRGEADRAIEALKGAGFAAEELSVVLREPSLAGDVPRGAGPGHRHEAEAAVGGSVVGGVAGLLAGLGPLTIPGLGAVLVAGPLAAAAVGAAVGVAVAEMIALGARGVSREQADHYADAVERGLILVTVHATAGREDEARRILDSHGSADAGAEAGGDDPASFHHARRLTARAVELAGESAGGVGVGSVAGLAMGDAMPPLAHGDGAPSLTFRDAEPRFRSHWESTRAGERSYDDVSHAYRYGWEGHDDPDHHGKSWEEISDRLAAGWPGEGDWHAHAPLVREGWEARRPG